MAHKADQNSAPVYGYVFTYGNSHHGAGIPYVFDHADENDEEKELASQISQAWINFAKTEYRGQMRCRSGSRTRETAERP
ncbi:MAG: hypothetical protein ACLT5A_12110 [Clostridiaceae bacterium]